MNLLEKVAELDVSLPALKAEVIKLKSDSHEGASPTLLPLNVLSYLMPALVEYWAEKLRLRTEGILAKYGPDPSSSPLLPSVCRFLTVRLPCRLV